MNRLIYFILIIISSCEISDYRSSDKVALSDVDRIAKLESTVAKLIADTQYKAKQITALKKADSIDNVNDNVEVAKLRDIIARYVRDSTLQWVQIKPATAIIPRVNYFLNTRFPSDSIKQWVYINMFTPIIPRVSTLTGIFKADSIKQWFEINRLKQSSPVTQIPLMQSQIKELQSKDLSFDKKIVSNTDLINNLYDSMEVLKVYVGGDSDIALDSFRRVIISNAGMNRIKAEIKQ